MRLLLWAIGDAATAEAFHVDYRSAFNGLAMDTIVSGQPLLPLEHNRPAGASKTLSRRRTLFGDLLSFHPYSIARISHLVGDDTWPVVIPPKSSNVTKAATRSPLPAVKGISAQ